MLDEGLAHHRLQVDGQLGQLLVQAALALRRPWTVLFGPSGSGKSSLLRAACGLLPPTVRTELWRRSAEGEGQRLDRLPVHRRELGYVPQGGAVFPHLSVERNVAFAAGVVETEAAIELFELGPLRRRMPASLSGGERQRVSLARAFARPGARLMLLDEPFTGIDRRLRARLLAAMQAELAQRGVPVISVTHDVEEVLLLGAEVVRIEAGRVLGQGAVEEVLAEELSALRRVLGDVKRGG